MKTYHVDLTNEERDYLGSLVKKRIATSESVKRSSILLAADRLGEKRWTDEQISKKYNVSIRTVERLRERLVNEGLTVALVGKPRLNLDKKIFDGETEAKLIALRCSEPPLGESGWTLRLLAGKMIQLGFVETISYESVRQILKKTKLSLGR